MHRDNLYYANILTISPWQKRPGTVELHSKVKSNGPRLNIRTLRLQACILPAVVIPIMVLVNRRRVMGKHAAGAKMNVGLAAVLAFALLTTYFAVAEFYADLI